MTVYVYRGKDEKPRTGRPLTPDDSGACGTQRGIDQHRRAGEKNCDKCRQETNRKRRASYRRNKQALVNAGAPDFKEQT